MLNFTVFPNPRSCKVQKSSVDFADACWVLVDPTYSSVFKGHALDFCRQVRESFTRPLGVSAGVPSAGQALLRILAPSRSLPVEGYDLECNDDAVVLRAGSEAGAFYGLQTFSQIVGQCGAVMPRFSISDSPDFAARGVMLDVSRCKVPTMQTLEGLVELFARLKINQVQLYCEHTFAFAAHETVWHDASPISAEEIIALDSFCRDHYIELVPNQNSFGHFERWLRHPEYKHLAECPDGFEYQWGGRSTSGSTLKPNQESLDFVGGLYAELLPNFTSRLFNIGCDETWELGKGWSKKECDKRGTTSVYLDFLLKIHRLVKKRGRRMMFWGDIILHNPELVSRLPKDIIALEWGYEADHDFDNRCAHFARAKVPFYVCPGTSSWNTITGRTANCLGNLGNAAKCGLKHGAIGYLNTDWGDGGHHQYLPISYPGFYAGAAFSWCGKTNDGSDVADAMNRMSFGDPTGTTGSVLVELGRVTDLLPEKRSNKTIFNDLLFCVPGDVAGAVKNSRRSHVVRALERLTELELELLSKAQPCCDDGALVKAEIKNAIDMTQFALRRSLSVFGDKVDRTVLRRQLLHIIGKHEDLWLARNRRGGLHESSARIRHTLEHI